jgi:hypothetical protein
LPAFAFRNEGAEEIDNTEEDVMRGNVTTAKLGARTAIAIGIISGFANTALAAPGDLAGAPIPVTPSGWGPARLASDSAGNFVATGLDTTGNIVAQRYTKSGTPIGNLVQIAAWDSANGGSLTNPTVAVDGSGDYVVVWESVGKGISWQLFPIPIRGPLFSYRVYPVTLHARTFHADGTAVSGDTKLPTFYASEPFAPAEAVAMDDDGDFVVSWWTERKSAEVDNYIPVAYATHGGVYARAYALTGKATTATLTVDTSRGVRKSPKVVTGRREHGAAVGMDGKGNFTVVWAASDTSSTATKGILGRSYTLKGAAVGGPFGINTSEINTADTTPLDMAMNSSGQFVVSWFGCTDTVANGSYCARSYQAGGTAAGGEIAVENDVSPSTAPSNIVGTRVAIDNRGDFIAASDNIDGSTFVRLFAANGQPLSHSVAFPAGAGISDVTMDAAGNALAAYNYLEPTPDGGSSLAFAFQAIAGP